MYINHIRPTIPWFLLTKGLLGSISATLSVSGEERGLITRTAAGNRGYIGSRILKSKPRGWLRRSYILAHKPGGGGLSCINVTVRRSAKSNSLLLRQTLGSTQLASVHFVSSPRWVTGLKRNTGLIKLYTLTTISLIWRREWRCRPSRIWVLFKGEQKLMLKKITRVPNS